MLLYSAIHMRIILPCTSFDNGRSKKNKRPGTCNFGKNPVVAVIITHTYGKQKRIAARKVHLGLVIDIFKHSGIFIRFYKNTKQTYFV
jgi:hypothetical protein